MNSACAKLGGAREAIINQNNEKRPLPHKKTVHLRVSILGAPPHPIPGAIGFDCVSLYDGNGWLEIGSPGGAEGILDGADGYGIIGGMAGITGGIGIIGAIGGMGANGAIGGNIVISSPKGTVPIVIPVVLLKLVWQPEVRAFDFK